MCQSDPGLPWGTTLSPFESRVLSSSHLHRNKFVRPKSIQTPLNQNAGERDLEICILSSTINYPDRDGPRGTC